MGIDPKPITLPELPELPLKDWQATYDTLHMWTQIVGKVRKTLGPAINHWWGVTFYLTSRGLTLGDHFKSGQQLSVQNRPTEVAVQD